MTKRQPFDNADLIATSRNLTRAICSPEAVEVVARANAAVEGWVFDNLEEGDPTNPGSRHGFHDPYGDPTKLLFRTQAREGLNAIAGMGEAP